VAVHTRLLGRGQASIVHEHHAALWKDLARLGEARQRRPVVAADPSVSLWQPPVVSVERRPLDVYAELEGRC
jgi:hypothetical protein